MSKFTGIVPYSNQLTLDEIQNKIKQGVLNVLGIVL